MGQTFAIKYVVHFLVANDFHWFIVSYDSATMTQLLSMTQLISSRNNTKSIMQRSLWKLE